MWADAEDALNAASEGAHVFQRRFVLLAEMSSDGICVHQDGQIVFANAAAVRWMGVSPATGLIGRRVAEFVHPDFYPSVRRRLDGLHREGDSAPPFEVVMGRPHKSARDVQATSTRMDWDGSPAVVTNFRDLTAVKASIDLKYQAALLDHVSDAVIGVSPTGAVTSWNSAAEQIYRRDAQHALRLDVQDAVGAPIDIESVLQRGGTLYTTHFAADGSPLSVRVSTATTENGHVVVCADLTALRAAERHFEAVVTAIDAGVVIFNPDGSVKSANPTARRILGDMVDGTTPFAHDVPLIDVKGIPITADRNLLRLTIESGAPQIDRVVGIARIDAPILWLSVSARLLSPKHLGHSPVLCSFIDVTEQMITSAKLRYAAGHDALTGLPNRSTVLSRISSSLATGAASRVTAVLFIDVDDMKRINDTHGHVAGDTVLIATATRITDALLEGDVIARLAGDEFVVLLFGHLERREVDRLADAIHQAMSKPVRYRAADVAVTVSIGVAMVDTDDVRDALELLRAADQAMYVAKAAGPGRTRYE